MRTQVLVDYFDVAVNQLLEVGYPAHAIIDALKVVTTRTELLHGGARVDGLKRLGTVADRLKALAVKDDPASGYDGPERRGPGRPWQRAET